MALSTTAEVLFERIAENVWGDQFPVKITATGGAAGTFVASSGGFESSDTNAYDGVWILMLDTTDDAAPEGEARRVTTAGFTVATGSWDINPDWSAGSASGDVGLFLYGLHPDQVYDAINDIQRSCYVPRYLVLSLCADANMENANATVATDWPDVTGTPTQTKETTEVLTGIQSLKIVTTVSGHSVRSPSIPVVEGEQLLLSAPIKCDAGSLQVILYDVTNSANIDSVTVDEAAWVEVRFEATVPNDCQNVQVRFASATASTTAYVDHVCLLSKDRSLYALPSQVADIKHLEGVYYGPFGYPSEATGSYVALGESLEAWGMGREWRDWRAVNAQRIEVGRVTAFPLFLKFRSVASTLSALTDTTPLPEDLVVAGAVAGCFRRLGDERSAAQWRRTYMDMLDRYGLAKPVTQYQPQRRVRVP